MLLGHFDAAAVFVSPVVRHVILFPPIEFFFSRFAEFITTLFSFPDGT